MSGIAGTFQGDLAPVAEVVAAAMAAAMAYRGPDGIAIWQGEGLALAHCKLATTPESLSEHQPLLSADQNLVLVADARLDNRAELASALGMSLHGAVPPSDSAMILEAFRNWGENCLQWLEGDFAFAVWQKRERRLFLARDRIGHKPLFWHQVGNSFAFASDVAALVMRPGQQHTLNQSVLAERLAAQWSGSDETLWYGVKRLRPAHSLTLDAGKLSISCYWTPDLSASLLYSQDADYAEHYAELLQDVVRRQSRSHLSLSCEVSGGLDSSAVFALAAGLQAQGTLQAPGLAGFTLDCSGDPAADEVGYVRALAVHLGLPITEVLPWYPDLSWFTERMDSSRDFPELPNNAMLLPLLDAAQSTGSRVIFNGMGGDEWLWGSRRYYEEEFAAQRWKSLAQCLYADLSTFGPIPPLYWLLVNGLFRRLPVSTQDTLRRAKRRLKPQDRWQGKPWLSQRTHDLLAGRSSPVADPIARAGQEEPAAFLQDGCRSWVLELGERMYASRGLEARSPMNSARVVQFALSLPERMKLRGMTHKYVHVQAMKGVLPELVRNRKGKADFSVAYLRQLKRLPEFFLNKYDELPADWVNVDKAAELYAAFGEQPCHGWRNSWLWHLYVAAKLLDRHGIGGQKV